MNLGSIKKTVFFIFLVFVSSFLFADSSDETKEETRPTTIDETEFKLDQSVDSVENKAGITEEKKPSKATNFDLAMREKPVASSSGLLQLIGSLLIITILAYIIIKFLKKSTVVFGLDDPYLKTVASINISQNKSVHIITVGEKAYIVGVTDSSINAIGEIEDKDLINAMNLEASRKSGIPKKDFASIFSQYFPKFRQEKQKENAGKDFFDFQRERINNASNLEDEDE